MGRILSKTCWILLRYSSQRQMSGWVIIVVQNLDMQEAENLTSCLLNSILKRRQYLGACQ